MAKYADKIVQAIDVGTTKICVLIGRKIDENTVDILGVGTAPSHGLAKGVVVDVAKTINAISTAVHEASAMAGIQVTSATIGISGGHIQSCNSMGVVPIRRSEVTQYDIAAVLAAARAIPVPEGLHILHVLPQYYVIDGRDIVHDPIGMHGVRLEVHTHIIMGAVASVKNLVVCCEKAGIIAHNIVLEQLASAQAVLTPDEFALGVAVMDIGGGTSDIAIYHRGSIRYTHVIPVAGNQFTQDIAIGLHTSLKEAERIKKIYGCVSPEVNCIEIDSIPGQTRLGIIPAHILRNISTPRAQELMSLAYHNIKTQRMLSSMQTGLVITGGGSLLQGLTEIAQSIFSLPIRIGNPNLSFDLPESLCNPIYATAYGLLLHSYKRPQDSEINVDGPLVKRVLDCMKSWVLDFF